MGLPFRQFAAISQNSLLKLQTFAREEGASVAAAIGCYNVLVLFRNGNQTKMRQATVAQYLGCHETAVARYLDQLKEAGVINIRDEGRGRCKVYELVDWLEPVDEAPYKIADDLDPGPEAHPPVGGNEPISDPPRTENLVQKAIRRVTRMFRDKEGKIRRDTRPKPEPNLIRKPNPEPESIPEPDEQPGTEALALEGPSLAPPEKKQPEGPVVPEDGLQTNPEPEIHVHLDPIPPELVNDNEYDPQSFAQQQLERAYPLPNGFWISGAAVLTDSQLMNRRSFRIELVQHHLDQRRKRGLPLKLKDRHHWLVRSLPQVEQTPAVRTLQSLLVCYRYKALEGVFKPVDGCYPKDLTVADVAQANRLTDREVWSALEQLGQIEDGSLVEGTGPEVVTELDGMPRLGLDEDIAFWSGMAIWKITRDPDGQLRCEDRVITLEELDQKRPIAARQIRAYLQRTQP